MTDKATPCAYCGAQPINRLLAAGNDTASGFLCLLQCPNCDDIFDVNPNNFHIDFLKAISVWEYRNRLVMQAR